MTDLTREQIVAKLQFLQSDDELDLARRLLATMDRLDEAEKRGWAAGMDKTTLPDGLRFIGKMVQEWIDWSAKSRHGQHLSTDDGTVIMSLPVPCWPTHGQMENWIKCFNGAADAITALEAELARVRGSLSAVCADRDAIAARLAEAVEGLRTIADSPRNAKKILC